MNHEPIHEIAKKLIKKHKTSNPFELAKLLNIPVVPGNLSTLKGFYVNMVRNSYIVVNMNLEEEEKKIICAHELGHHLLHKGLNIKFFHDNLCISKHKSIPEIEANYFAAELLIADEDMEELLSYGYTYEQIAAELGVHKELVIIKGTLLNKRGHKLKVPYMESYNYLKAK